MAGKSMSNQTGNLLDRDEIVSRVVKTLSRLRAHGPLFNVTDDKGVAPVHIALGEDRVGDVQSRVIRMGGAANVLIATDETLTMISWHCDVIAKDAIDDVDVHEDITLTMLMAWLDSHDGAAHMNLVRATRESMKPKELEYQF